MLIELFELLLVNDSEFTVDFVKAGQKFAGRAMAPDPSSAPVPPASWVKDEPSKPVSIKFKKNTCCSFMNLPLLI